MLPPSSGGKIVENGYRERGGWDVMIEPKMSKENTERENITFYRCGIHNKH
jgi:hypothetical protein